MITGKVGDGVGFIVLGMESIGIMVMDPSEPTRLPALYTWSPGRYKDIPIAAPPGHLLARGRNLAQRLG
jgi:hypothetical protein